MKKTGAILIIAMLSFSACSNKHDEKKTADTYEKGKLTVAEIEEKNPERFLAASGTNKRNLLGQTVVKGNIINHAKMVGFKDIDIKLSFYSKTGALLEEDREVIYETVNGPVTSPHEMFRLVLGHPQFTWLGKISSLIALLDEASSPRRPATEATAQGLLVSSSALGSLTTRLQNGEALGERLFSMLFLRLWEKEYRIQDVV